MKRAIKFLGICFIIQQICGNHLVAINLQSEEIFSCNTVTFDCNKISYLELMVIRETNSCSRQELLDPIFQKPCR